MDRARHEQFLNSLDAKADLVAGAEEAKIKIEKIKNVIHGVFSMLPHRIGSEDLGIVFSHELEEIFVLYGESTIILRTSVENFDPHHDLLPELMNLHFKFSREDMKSASDGMFDINVEHPRNQNDIQRIAEDIHLLFSELPQRVIYNAKGFSLHDKHGQSKEYFLNVIVNMPNCVQRLSWFASYTYNNKDSLDMSFAPMGKDDEVSYWHDHRLTRRDILFGMKESLNIDLDAPVSTPYGIKFAHDADDIAMKDRLGLSAERVNELYVRLKNAQQALHKSGNSFIDMAYEDVAKECRTTNELFFIGWLCGQGH